MRRTPRLLIALLSMGLMLSACGGDEDSENQETTNQENANQDNTNQDNTNQEDLVDLAATLEADGNFTTLLAALDAADLTATLEGEDEYTVFAPDDDAFDALPEGTLDDLLLEENQAQLEEILLYHVVPGTITSEDVAAGEVATAAGIDVEISVDGETISYGGSEITDVDLMASNGVIHTLDAVALPPTDEEPDPSIVDIVTTNEDFSLLAEAVTEAGLVDALDGDDDLTVFAPTDEAFNTLLDDLGVGGVDEIDSELLTSVLTYHVLNGRVTSDAVSPGVVNSMDGRVLLIDDEDGLAINSSAITETDIEASNGVIHVIDTVIVPPGNLVDVAVDNEFDALVGAVQTAGLVDTLSGEDHYTVFAPRNQAFDDVSEITAELTEQELADVLLYHVLPGAISSYDVEPGTFTTAAGADVEIAADGGLTYGGSNITITDVVAENGIIHVIDAVTLPPE